MGDYDLLKTNWKKLKGQVTDQAKKFKKPLLEKEYDHEAKLIDLIPHEQFTIGQVSFTKVAYQRRSRRKGSSQPLTFEELSFLLFFTNGVKLFDRPMFRTVPSAGARHAFETYIQVERVESLEKGLYRYLPLSHQLLFLKKGSYDEVVTGFLGQNFNAGVLFMWTAIPYRMAYRYKDESEKLILIDVGHLCQNLYLACESIGLGACGIGAYDQEYIDEYIEVDGKEEVVVYNATVVK
ncbi:MAG: SagB/ThcOx family dehydrogenase [Clostridiales bacterium]|nr:SagB/ThcOx family dehydrogenase [Clostridiales bacterium]